MENVTITKVENGYIVNRQSVLTDQAGNERPYNSIRVFQKLGAALQSVNSFFEDLEHRE